MDGQLGPKKRDESVRIYTTQYQQICEDMTNEIAYVGCEALEAPGK